MLRPLEISEILVFADIAKSSTASFANAIAPRKDERDSQMRGPLPQSIAHRGYKAEYPENTMDAFRAAVAIGAHAIETDLHLTKDKVVVLSHVSDALTSPVTICVGSSE
jgi:glycerophosphoryl diester phosphodiesterase